MSEPMGGYRRFVKQIDLFLKRYYLNRAFKGMVAGGVLLLVLVLVLGLVQWIGFWNGTVRAVLFYAALGVLVAEVCGGVVFPLLQAYGRVGRMSRMQAARYLSERFPEAGDRLCNVLELNDLIGEEGADETLLRAAIGQITDGFISYRFERAVKARSILPYIYGLAVCALIFFLVFVFEPAVVKSTAQVIRYNTEFEREFPFRIDIVNSSLSVAYENDFKLSVNVEGEKLPEKVFLCQGQRILALSAVDANSFTYVFKKVRQDEVFRLKAGKYVSSEYTLKVNRKPLLSAMKAVLRYPAYTGKEVDVITNSLDLTVPVGTSVEWELKMDYTRALRVWKREDSLRKALAVDSVSRPVFRFATRAFRDFDYFLAPSAYGLMESDTLSFEVKTVPDAYPHIQVGSETDSLYPLHKFYTGFISDDYGFSALVFTVRCVNASSGLKWEKFDTLSINRREREQAFTYNVDLARFALEPGDELSYGFVLADNDPFYPYKTVYSPMESYRKMSMEEVREELERTSNSVESSLSMSLQQSRSFGEELEKMVEELLSKQQFSWQDLQKVELLMEQQKELRSQYEALNEELKRKQELEAERGLENAELMEMQRELQELLRELLDDKTLEKLAELQQLMEKQAAQDKVMDKLEELKFNEAQMAKDLEQNMNLYRMMEFELRMDQIGRDMQQLLKKAEEMKESMAGLNDRQMERVGDSLEAMNRKLGEEMERLGSDLQELKKLDEKLDKPNGFKVPDSLLSRVERDIEKTASDLKGGREGKKGVAEQSREDHKQTQKDMEKLADNLSEQFEAIEEENAAEDADFIRLLLKSILRISLEQEDLMVQLEKTRVNDPRYADFIRRQSALNLEIGFVSDSVRAIARRQPQVAVSTRLALKELERNSRESLEYLLGMNNVYYQRYSTTNSWALTRQQYTMTALNDLALMLSESLDHMKESMMKGGSSNARHKKKQKGQAQMSCPSPGDKPSEGQQKFPSLSKQQKEGKDGKDSKTLQQMQKALNEQLEALKKMLEEKAKQDAAAKGQQQKEGGVKGSSGKSGEGGEQVTDEQLSEAFARAAAAQEKIRRMLQDKMARDKGNAANGLYNSVLGDMEKTEKDLVNKFFGGGLMERQKKIETRLLEAENAELKREKDDKRESRQGQVFAPVVMDSLNVAGKTGEKTRELLLHQTPDLRPFYRKKVQEYLFGE